MDKVELVSVKEHQKDNLWKESYFTLTLRKPGTDEVWTRQVSESDYRIFVLEQQMLAQGVSGDVLDEYSELLYNRGADSVWD